LRQTHDDIYNTPGAAAAAEEEANRFQTFYEEYNMTLHQENNASTSQNLSLLPICIPELNVEFLDWLRFHDLFVELVHNKPYSASQKLHILQGAEDKESKEHFDRHRLLTRWI